MRQGNRSERAAAGGRRPPKGAAQPRCAKSRRDFARCPAGPATGGFCFGAESAGSPSRARGFFRFFAQKQPLSEPPLQISQDAQGKKGFLQIFCIR